MNPGWHHVFLHQGFVGQRQQIMRVNVRLIESVIIINFVAVSLVFLAAKLQRAARILPTHTLSQQISGRPGTFRSPSRPKSSGSSVTAWLAISATSSPFWLVAATLFASVHAMLS